MNDDDTAPSLDELVPAAQGGDRTALEALLGALQHGVYNLAMRMLAHPDDAADATQEVLLRVATQLGTFRGESAFRTWVFRVASNHLLNARRGRVEARLERYEQMAAAIEFGLGAPQPPAPDPEASAIAREIELSCTHAMLVCLDREHRLSYILGELLAMPADDAAFVLEVAPAAFRKRLSRARERVREFLEAHCGLENPDAACRCARQVPAALATGRVDPVRLPFARHPTCAPRHVAWLRRRRGELVALRDAVRAFEAHPDYAAPPGVLVHVRALLNSGRYEVAG